METMHTNDRVYRVKINDQNVKVTPYISHFASHCGPLGYHNSS